MRFLRVAAPLSLLAAAWAAQRSGAPEPVRALVGVPALLWAPGAAWAGGERDPLARLFRALALGLGMAVPLLVIGRLAGVDAIFGAAAVIVAAGAMRRRVASTGLGAGPTAGVASVGLAVAGAAWASWPTVALPLDGYWWSAAAEALPEGEGDAVTPGGGWASARSVGAAWVLTPAGESAELAMGEGVLAVRGPVGATLEVDGSRVTIEADPTVETDEGPVPRYLDRGVAALAVAHGGSVRLSDPAHSVLYAVPSADALWELHGASELRFAHYYQLLNMVEQLRWARELGVSRWVTDVQPPMWSWPLALVLLSDAGGQPTANVLFLYVVLAVGCMGVRVVRAAGGVGLAWGLPALAAAQHVRMMLEPGSTAMPDSLYTLAALGVVAGSGVGWGLVAQLARYPGTLLAGLLLAAGRRGREALTLIGVVAACAAGFALVGHRTGALPGWLETVAWETGPEHWHGQTAPAVLLPRVPVFLRLWAAYAGGAPLLALTARRAPGRLAESRTAPRALMAAALGYAALLCTVDHTPSHYFLPLLHLSVVAVACAPPGRFGWRHLLQVAGLTYALIAVPITG